VALSRKTASNGLRQSAGVSQVWADTAESIDRYRQATALLRDAAEGALAEQAPAALDAEWLTAIFQAVAVAIPSPPGALWGAR
jgi:hypothetical protein